MREDLSDIGHGGGSRERIGMEHLILRTPAKVNLYLEVRGVFEDGTHELSTVFQEVDLCDIVTVEPARSLEVRCVPDVVGEPESNTAYRAAVAFSGIVGRHPGVRITIEKRIPDGAGLGGGSSDAAAVIVALAKVWGEDPVGQDALAAAKAVGADVPFFLFGGAGLFGGRGDELLRRMPPLEAPLVLVSQGQSISTALAYSAFDASPSGSAEGPPDVGEIVSALEAGDASRVAASLRNDLGPIARRLCPKVEETASWIVEQPGVLGAQVTGSGAAVFAVADSAEAAERIAQSARSLGWWSVVANPRSAGVEFLEER
ncbi:MAG: 4-(cytidine 5'-diphospho)-2-C-methyl-D-erythritol kinase [Coriobacteriia bacterium]